MTRIRPDGTHEQGATLIIVALSVVVLMAVTALALDMSQLRTDRRVNKSTADFAVTAGVNELQTSPWAGVCEARDWLLANSKEFSSFTSTTQTNGTGASVGNICSTPTSATYLTPCASATATTHARFTGTAAGGRITVRIESPYTLPDPTFGEDATITGDDGAGCQQMAVIVTEQRRPGFAAAVPGYNGTKTTRIRSVGRLQPGGPPLDPASLVLLERTECQAARTQGSATRIIIDSKAATLTEGPIAGVIQSDSAGTGSPTCNGGGKVLEGQSTSGGPSIIAKHARDTSGNIQKLARIGITAKLLGNATAHTAYPGSIGEPDPVGWPQIGRGQPDREFLANVQQLESDATAMVNLTTLPAGFTDASGPAPGLNLGCNINTAVPVTTPSKLWFNCPGGLLIQQLTVTAADAEIVVNGPLQINSPGLTVSDSRKLWVKGKSNGNNRGIDVGSGGSLILNTGGAATCAARLAADRTKVGTLFLKEGAFLSSNTTLKMCQTMAYLRGANSPSGGSYLPASAVPDGTLAPAPANNSSLGTINIGSGSIIDWSAPNELDTRPTAADRLVHKFEDLALWTEASDTSVLSGGGGLNLAGIFFLGNANPFGISGNAAQAITLDAQFWTRKLDITGNSILTMVPNPNNQIPLPSPKVALVR